MHLIVTEKYNAAQRISSILSNGNSSRSSVNDVPVFIWNSGETKCIGLAGHIVELDFPEEYNNWNEVDPSSLIDAPIITTPSKEDIVTALQKLTKEADELTIATDYDREGELIGKEALDLVNEVSNSPIPTNRARFSSLSTGEVSSAFASPEDIDYNLAAAGKARQIIDLRWGASLTRFFTLASPSRDSVMSVGRVQTPTLKLIVDREREIQNFDPEPYWEITAAIRTADGETNVEGQYYYLNEDDNEAVRLWDETRARAIYSTIHRTDEGKVTSMQEKERNDYPPTPFNTTEFIKAAGAIGFDAKPAMSIAEDLYDNGFITYPRTDNTVYPDDLDAESRLEKLQHNVPPVEDGIRRVLSQDTLSATSGDTESTDHPPIHPTPNTPSKQQLNDAEWKIYELVVRRFASTFARPAVWNHRRIDVIIEGHHLKSNGKTLVEPGYHAVYPYFDTTEDKLPMLSKGTEVQIGEAELIEKETQPPNRFGQSSLIGKMEELELGTKSTRHNTIDKLYNRDYIQNKPPEPTERAFALIGTADTYAPQMTTADTTSELKNNMDAIANGEKSLEEVTDLSQDVLRDVFQRMEESRDALVRALNTPIHINDGEEPTEEDALGRCPECNDLLLPRQSKKGSKFIGCDGYPECEFTLPLPNKGRVHFMDETCDKHEYKRVKMIAGSETQVYGCPQCQEDKANEAEDEEIGECPECGSTQGGILAIKQVRTGSRLIGCTRYPDCDYSLPVPQSGQLKVTQNICEDHSLPELEIHKEDQDSPWELGCPICNYESM